MERTLQTRPADERMLTAREVMARTTLSRTTIYKLVRKGQMPKPVRLGGSRRSAWRTSDIDGWLAAGAPVNSHGTSE